ncbi:MAG: hypothetical protein K0S32_3648 [Bacteroidetes bacterium]|jgi:ABC-type uncharacterized transport system YnjBCD permease subunit|nr:hypothetical protein [Bacteroidota bacterium]
MNNKDSRILGIGIVQLILVLCSLLIFYSLLNERMYGYQLYFIFLIVPALTLLQFLKIYLIYITKKASYLFLVSIFSVFLFYIPLIDSASEKAYLTFFITYSIIFVIFIFESSFIYKQRKT